MYVHQPVSKVNKTSQNAITHIETPVWLLRLIVTILKRTQVKLRVPLAGRMIITNSDLQTQVLDNKSNKHRILCLCNG